jgi:aldose 1-epimerase
MFTIMQALEKPFGFTRDNQEVHLFMLESASGMRAEFISYGAALKSLCMPDARGEFRDVTYGFETLAEYEAHRFFFGATIGRFGNRIAHGSFSLGGADYTLAKNDNAKHHLHGGETGFDRRVWKGSLTAEKTAATVTFTYDSPDGEEGYPGNLAAEVTYTVTDADELIITYTARTDKTTPFNPTNHSFWNLACVDSGEGKSHDTIESHLLQLHCPLYIPADDDLIPTGEILSVKGTPMDFTSPKSIGKDIDRVLPNGYDHCFVIDPHAVSRSLPQGIPLRCAALLKDPASGRAMEVLTTMPGVHVYSGNFIQEVKTAGGMSKRRGALCLETEQFPDSVNRPYFPSPLLKPGETFFSQTVHRFFAD